MPDDFFGTMNFPKERLAGLKQIRNLLTMDADASLAVGDVSSAVADLEILLRTGDHLRSQNSFLLLITGMGMEKEAKARIEIGLKAKQFSPEDRKRLLSASRTRTAFSELGTTMRYERGLFISKLERLAKATSAKRKIVLNPFIETSETTLATACLVYCQQLQPALTANSEQGWQDLKTAVNSAAGSSRKANLGTAGLDVYAKIIGPLLQHDDDFSAMRSKLAE